MPLAVGLYRADKLTGAIGQWKSSISAEVKGAVRDVVQEVLPILLAAADGAAPGSAGAGYGSGQHMPEVQLGEQLQVRGQPWAGLL
jgi:hypothetical protein